MSSHEDVAQSTAPSGLLKSSLLDDNPSGTGLAANDAGVNLNEAREAISHSLGRVERLLTDIEASPLSYRRWRRTLQDCTELVDRVTSEVARERLGPPRVVVIGRTKAGKSTLRFVLTGEGREGIGKGGQRTTREALDYTWRDLHVVDTPGVGGLGTEDDAAIALDAADRADLILWVTASDGVQLETEVPVLRAARGRPLLVLVNHKSTFELEEITSGLSSEVIYSDRDGLEARIRERLSKVGVPHPEITHVHLGLARRARFELADGQLAAQSGVEVAENQLREAAAAAVALRSRTAAHRLLLETDELTTVLRTAASLIETHRQHLRKDHDELVGQLRAARKEHDTVASAALKSARAEAIASLDAALQAASIQPIRERAQLELAASIGAVCLMLEAAGKASLITAGAAARRHLPDHLARPDHCHAVDASSPSVNRDAVSLDGNPRVGQAVDRAVQVALGGAALAATIATDGLAAFLIGPAVGVLGNAGRRFTRGLLPSGKGEKAKRASSIERTGSSLHSAIDEWHSTVAELVENAADGLASPVTAQVGQLSERLEKYSIWVALLRQRVGELSESADNLRNKEDLT